MRILFLHDNFPAQFGVFGQYLAREGWDVWFGTQRKNVRMDGLKIFNYAPHRAVTEKIHPYVGGFEKAVLTGQALARTGLQLKAKGFSPDVVMAHSGWGPGLFVNDVWPDAKYIGYFEWYYGANAPDIAFINDKERGLDDQLRSRMRNAAIQMDLTSCTAGLCPTEFQKSQFPDSFEKKLTVMHDGIDTDTYRPIAGARLQLPNLNLGAVDELITYVARGMEPYRGFPEFMKALEVVLGERPKDHPVIVGEDRVAYGSKLDKGDSYKKRALQELDLDPGRVHFTGLLPRHDYLKVLQASSVHVYLTIPFVLSWSMMEAMSAGCAIVSSSVAPVSEMNPRSSPTLLPVDHRDTGKLVAAIVELLEDRDKAAELGENARKHILNRYAMTDIFPKKQEWLKSSV